jgi:ABC-type nitrate/sulfonate/bicarbonate transport system permease component
MAVAFFRGKRALVALPVFDVLQSFPTFAALPLAIYFWGPSNFTTIFFLIFTIIWPIFFAILSSLKLMKHEWDEVAEIYGLTGKEYLKKFLIPVSVPGLITGSIVGLGEAWEAVVATEIIVGMQSGLGPFFQSFAANSGVTVFGILGFLILIFSINKIIWIPLLDWSHSFIEE